MLQLGKFIVLEVRIGANGGLVGVLNYTGNSDAPAAAVDSLGSMLYS